MSDIGREFEEDFAKDMGLKVVPGSGNQWHSKLDVFGGGSRWSLKATSNYSFKLVLFDIEEAIKATGGPGGTGEIPLWGIRLAATTPDETDLVVMLKEDFKKLAMGEMKIINPLTMGAGRFRNPPRSILPELLREESDG